MKLKIGTPNIRTLLDECELYDLQRKLGNIQWNVIGLAELRRKGKEYVTL